MNNIASIGHMFNALNHTIVQLNVELENMRRDMDTLRTHNVEDVKEIKHTNANGALEELKKELSTKASKTEIEAIQTSITSLTTEIAKLAMVTSLFPRVSALETKEAERSLQPRSLKAEDVQRMIAEYSSSSIPPEMSLDTHTFKVDIQLPPACETLQEEQVNVEVVDAPVEPIEPIEPIESIEPIEPIEQLSKTTKVSKASRGRGRGSKKTVTV